jgi:uncharacterized membrane protein
MPAKLLMGLATENNKVAHVVGAATTGTGLATYLEIIGPYVGVGASIIGSVFTVVLIVVNIRRDRRETREHDLWMKKHRADKEKS